MCHVTCQVPYRLSLVASSHVRWVEYFLCTCAVRHTAFFRVIWVGRARNPRALPAAGGPLLGRTNYCVCSTFLPPMPDDYKRPQRASDQKRPTASKGKAGGVHQSRSSASTMS
eukprot:scaffold1397_cov122-Isochrysis_galbana.AAC.2